MNTTEQALKPCPFCGDAHQSMMPFDTLGDDSVHPIYFVQCDNVLCGASGPPDTHDKAEEKWNKRVECGPKTVATEDAGRVSGEEEVGDEITKHQAEAWLLITMACIDLGLLEEKKPAPHACQQTINWIREKVARIEALQAQLDTAQAARDWLWDLLNADIRFLDTAISKLESKIVYRQQEGEQNLRDLLSSMMQRKNPAASTSSTKEKQ